jgi:hypothetical protein
MLRLHLPGTRCARTCKVLAMLSRPVNIGLVRPRSCGRMHSPRAAPRPAVSRIFTLLDGPPTRRRYRGQHSIQGRLQVNSTSVTQASGTVRRHHRKDIVPSQHVPHMRQAERAESWDSRHLVTRCLITGAPLITMTKVGCLPKSATADLERAWMDNFRPEVLLSSQ